jgi:IS6 family transposase
MLLAPSISGLFKWRQFEPEVILLAVGWYLRFSLSYREVEELLAERCLLVDHVTVWRWVQRYAPELQGRLRRHLKPTSDSWRVDETYIRIKGKWCYLYRAVDSTGATLDFLLSAKQDAAAAKRFQSQSLGSTEPSRAACHQHRWACGLSLSSRVKERWTPAASTGRCRSSIMSWSRDHRAIKRRVNASQGFRSFWAAWRTLVGYEVIHMIRKGQACGSAPTRVGLLHRFYCWYVWNLSSPERPDGGGPPAWSAFAMSGGTVVGMLVWMPSNSGGAWVAITSVTSAPQSPPCATN